MQESEFDLVVLGAGPGGYVAAIRAAHQGLKAALVEERSLGGVCLHTGCIPTKTMVASVGLLRQARASMQLGVEIALAEAQLAVIIARRQKVVQQLAGGVKMLLEKNLVQVFPGRGCLAGPGRIEVEANGQKQIVRGKALILATGSRPADLPVAPRDGLRLLNSEDLLRVSDLPAELLIIVGGYIGCEFAGIFAALESKITILEATGRLLPHMDKELGQALERSFKRAGIQIVLNAKITSVEAADPVQVTLADGQIHRGAKLLVSVGRKPNVEGLGLETAGVQFTDRGIQVDDYMETTCPGVFSIGDVTGKMALAHVATSQARVVVENLLRASRNQERERMNYDAVPACVFTYPEIATVGLTEEEAAQRGLAVRVGRFPFAAIGKALAMGETEGFVKLIADASTGRLIGGHIFGGHASELIGQVTLAVRLGATAQQVAETIFAHPTLSESILEAAESLFGSPIHLPPRPAAK
jgi:dihydrolipoamide dehydrogenase